ncbi:MAG: phospholipid carrier-dependent glycosyltransferase, partial [Candidatus Nanopelagicales bacterium]
MSLLLGPSATLAAGYTALRLSLAARGMSRHERLLLFGGLFIAQAVLTQLFVGVLLRLTPLWVASLNVGLALLTAGLLRRKPRKRRNPSDDQDVYNRVSPVRSAGLLTGARSLGRGLVAAAGGSPLAWALVVILVLQSALVLWTAAVLPPQGWDEWWYHLPPIAHWVETGRVDLLPVAAEWQDSAAVTAMDDYQRRYRLSVTGFWANVYPLNVETWAMWSLLFLHSDRWVDAAQWPFILLGALAVYGLARWARLKAPGPLLAGLLWALLPINQMQARTAYTDTALAALTLAALLFFLRWAESTAAPGPAAGAHFLAAGLFLGLALGTKPPALAYAVLLGLVTLVLVARRPAGGALWHRFKAGLGQALVL